MNENTPGSSTNTAAGRKPSGSSRTNNQQGNQRRNFWNNRNRNSNAISRAKGPTTSIALPLQDVTERNLINSPCAAPTSSGSGSSSTNSTNPTRRNNLGNEYPGWHLYFSEKFNPLLPTVSKVKAFEQHFQAFKSTHYDFAKIRKDRWFNINVQVILNDCQLMQKWKTFHEDLLEKPEHTLSCAGLAMQTLIYHGVASVTDFNNTQTENCGQLQMIRVRIIGSLPVKSFKSLKVNNYDRLVSIRGTVIRAGASEIMCAWMAFQCNFCKSRQVVRQPEGNLTYPGSCPGNQCKARSNFKPLLSSVHTKTEAYQILRLQEVIKGDNFDSGNIPRSIDIELTNDLVDTVCPGDDVTVTGILKCRLEDERGSRWKETANSYKMYIKAISVISNSRIVFNKKSEFTEKDIEAIKAISEEPNTFKLLVHSLCPTIYGHEMVKAGLVLGLFGGAGLQSNGRRSEIHVLLVGDPGLGKSQMLRSCANVSPRGIFVGGRSTSNAGLTVTVRSEKGCGGSGGTIEAGALVLADEGVCCIDEFDKMSINHQALLEVMEQRTVSVAKAGVLRTISARTSILAAANPSKGHFDKSRTVSENLRLNPALLSRFDLIFILLDRNDKELDSCLSAHIQNLLSGEKKILRPAESTFSFRTQSSGNMSLEEQLKSPENNEFELLPQILMQKYIAYTRRNIHPKMTSEAANELKEYYLNLRKIQRGTDSIPITTRFLEGLVRLTQARARIDLSPEATIKHALDVLEIVKYSLLNIFSADDGSLQLDYSINSSGASRGSQVKKLLKIINIYSVTRNKTVFDVNELRDIARNGGVTHDFDILLENLNIQGHVLKRGRNLYQIAKL